MKQIQSSCKGFPGTYYHFSYSAESYQTFSGGIMFSKTRNEDDMIDVGTIQIADQLEDINLESNSVVNPFLKLPLPKLKFNDMLV